MSSPIRLPQEYRTGLLKPLPDILSSTIDRSEARNFRLQCRIPDEMHGNTRGYAPGHAQANFVCVPENYAFDFMQFCLKNPLPLPLLEVLEAGKSISKSLAPGADIRSDVLGYRIIEDGEVTQIVGEARPLWRDDLVTFFLGSSVVLDDILAKRGFTPAHLERNLSIPNYETNIPLNTSGPFRGNLFVSARPYKVKQAMKIAEITSHYPSGHGSPIHIGDPADLGIIDKEGNLIDPIIGDQLTIDNDDVLLFWASSVSGLSALKNAKIPFAIKNGWNQFFITDVLNEELHVSYEHHEHKKGHHRLSFASGEKVHHRNSEKNASQRANN